jgi:ABC-type multidrug transport system fused ATPase/permease subunit
MTQLQLLFIILGINKLKMGKLILELFGLLTPVQKKRFYLLQVLVVITAFFEIVGVASIAPFMALVGDVSILERDNVITSIYQISGIRSASDFVFYLGMLVLITLAIGSMVSAYTTWRVSMFATRTGTEIASSLFSYYLSREWLFHSSRSSSQFTKKIANESNRVTISIILPLMIMNSKIVLVVFLSSLIFIYDPTVAIIGLSFFAISYYLLFRFVRVRLESNGKTVSNMHAERFKLMNQGFGGIRDILLLGRGEYFEKEFYDTGHYLSEAEGTNNALHHVPRYFMELVSYGAMISMVLLLLVTYDGNLGFVLPILAVYALAGLKLLPALQQIYASISQIKGNLSAFESIKEDFTDSIRQERPFIRPPEKANFLFASEIELKDVRFSYPGNELPTLNHLDIIIKANSTVGIVGPSGSGKSTLVDLIIGLISPDTGGVFVDGNLLTDENIRQWKNNIGYVSQAIFLSEGSILENIAFGLPVEQIDIAQIDRVLRLSHLEKFVSGLAEGVNTKVGERGVQLSGGQRQRIGIARALYNDAKIIVFDEATSALDGVTERAIMDAIDDFSGNKTIIMIAHRLSTIKNCDVIFLLENGLVAAHGSYLELSENSKLFKRMSGH